MSATVLNWIIFVSIAGISALFARNTFFPPKQNLAILSTTLVAQASVSPTPDSQVPCQSEFFNFTKGTTWKYQITTKTEGTKNKQTVKSDIFTSKIIDASGSSVLIESQFVGEKEKTQNKITCRASGIYGLPIPPSLSLPSLGNLDSILLLPPEEKLHNGESWKSELGLLGLAASSTVTNQNTDTITISSKLDSDMSFIKSFLKDSKNVLEYTLEKGKGLKTLKVNLDIPSIQRIGINLQQLSYTLSD